MKCQYCGFENLESSHVCRKCGATLGDQTIIEEEKSSNQNTIIALLAVIIVILLIVGGLLVFGINNKTTDLPTTPVNNTTQPKVTNEVLCVANGSGSGSNFFTLDSGNYVIKLSVTPLNNKSYFYLLDVNDKLFSFKWDKGNLTTSNASINFTNDVSRDFTLYFKDIKSWNIEIIKIK